MSHHWPTPLKIYIVWHYESSEGGRIAQDLFRFFFRNVETDREKGIGIPVFYRRGEPGVPIRPIHASEATSEAIVVIVLVDEFLIDACQADQDRHWLQFMGETRKWVDEDPVKRLLLPVALCREALRAGLPSLEKLQAHRWFDRSAEYGMDRFSKCMLHLTIELTASMASLLMSQASSFPEDKPKRVRLFLSHAKIDGRDVTLNFRQEIQRTRGLCDFFDEHDLDIGSDFELALEHGVHNSNALLVILTDQYSQREWCCREVLTAKKKHLPILLAYAVHQEERRSFPYLGNVPSVPFFAADSSEAVLRVLQQILKEILRMAFWRSRTEPLNASPEAHDATWFFPNPPELLTLLHDCHEKSGMFPKKIVYPDPPLNVHEKGVLEMVLPGTSQLVTLSQFLAEG
ncbi:MAG: toll/interleukin-1 receptor domain-containing protein [Magnetococcales bacterium]|nr:toll/interleukin-1 receptor domain-containing protein [Magnetococcales bacterium]MBF0630210.1 toll/interleukin-1 receptor domain-containing protein [Magnetococcales bacterium]